MRVSFNVYYIMNQNIYTSDKLVPTVHTYLIESLNLMYDDKVIHIILQFYEMITRYVLYRLQFNYQ